MPRVLFVNGGILGLVSFQRFLERMLPRQSAIAGDHIVLTEDVTLVERIVRRLAAVRLWKDGLLGLNNLDLVRFRLELFAGLAARSRIARCRPRPDVLHFHRQATAYGSLGLMREVPSIVSIDCTQECVVESAPGLERASYAPNVRVDGAIFRRAAAIIATSEWAASSVRRSHPDCRAPVHVLPNPVLLEHFDAAWVETRAARATRGAMPRLLFVGGDFPRKGGYDLLDAWEAGDFHRRAALDIVSDWTIDRPLPRGVTLYTGVRSHTREWRERWVSADLFVLPTRNEAFGLVFQEAAAAGLPAIGTRHNAIPEIVLDGESGLLVPIGDRAALIEAIDRLVGSAALREQYGRRARAFIEQSADPDGYMRQLTAIVLDAVKMR
jgi:glycosyltransferase involved in cell wall biosynthesis